MKTTQTRTRILLSVICFLSSSVCFSQLSLGAGMGPFDLNVLIEASALDSVENDFILGASGDNLPLPLEPFPTASGGLKIESDNILDHITDTGARTVFLEVLYEDSADVFSIRQEVVEMNGTNAVIAFGSLGGIGVRRVRRMTVHEVGNQELDPPAGTITASIGAIPISEIKPGRGRSEIAVWTTGPTRREQVNAVELTFSTSGVGGQEWQIVSSALSIRQFSIGHGWVTTGDIRAREPQSVLPVVLNVPFPIPLLTDLRYKVGQTTGTTRNIGIRIQIVSSP